MYIWVIYWKLSNVFKSSERKGRTFKSDYFLLYAINRINGMSHEEAAFSLVSRGEDVLIYLA